MRPARTPAISGMKCRITCTSRRMLSAALAGAGYCGAYLAAQVLRSPKLQSFARYIEPNAMLVSLAKGLGDQYGSAHVAGHYRELEEGYGSAVLILRAIGHIPHRVRY